MCEQLLAFLLEFSSACTVYDHAICFPCSNYEYFTFYFLRRARKSQRFWVVRSLKWLRLLTVFSHVRRTPFISSLKNFMKKRSPIFPSAGAECVLVCCAVLCCGRVQMMNKAIAALSIAAVSLILLCFW